MDDKAIKSAARKIADDLCVHWHLRKRGDHRGLRPNEVKIMQEAWGDADATVERRIRALLKKRRQEKTG